MIILSAHGDALGDPGAIGWAWIDHTDGNFDSGGAASGTDQSAGLTAVLRAIEAHPGDEPLLVESGSQQAIRVASEWLPVWKANGWRTAADEAVPDADIVRALDQAVAARTGPVRFRHVRGHIDSPFHERARHLAELSAADWSAGRGDLDGFLIGNMPPSARSADLADEPAKDAVGDGGVETPRASRPGTSHDGRGDTADHQESSRAAWESATLF
ncbi:ribonuclease HI [Myceligenerans sp. TRM 65318]|uniref:Ribonuclease HI n=1 Tax=Myceligenerans pegani TaxID=2776917 RepID=A0ABR9N034_9MICO|nr:RNase H family protein [Myceligenerans sp. TRM 65318]MBE1877017.1 ribonuclease HI [Myceligenerans sp. TRM 65318]MBE3019288.1 ribonuclease HI [Myceligenerans sp. TRM 65318]